MGALLSLSEKGLTEGPEIREGNEDNCLEKSAYGDLVGKEAGK